MGDQGCSDAEKLSDPLLGSAIAIGKRNVNVLFEAKFKSKMRMNAWRICVSGLAA